VDDTSLALAPLATVRAALPPLWHNDFDELEDVVRLVMDVNVPVANEHRDDIVTHLVGLWTLAKATGDENPIDLSARATIIEHTSKALHRLRASAGQDSLDAVQREVEATKVWELPDREAAAGLLEDSI
jgi:hypothetical protein